MFAKRWKLLSSPYTECFSGGGLESEGGGALGEDDGGGR